VAVTIKVMMSVRSRCAIVLLLLGTATLFAQTRPLNPTVRVLPRATATVPEECEEGAAPQQPIQRAPREELQIERDPSRDLEPPPSRDLRSHLQAAQIAAERNDREGFRAAVESAKTVLSTYPPGGERTAAGDVINVYNDLDRLWEYQFSSPTGAFFSAASENGTLLTALERYRGYNDFIRPQVIVDASGTRFYPTRESREFLIREAADRLTRLGFPAPPRRLPTPAVGRETPPRPQPARIEPAPKREPQPQPTTTARREPSKRRTTPTRRAQTTSPRRTERRSEPPPTTATTVEVPLPPPVVSTTAAPVVSATTATETTATSPTTTSMPPAMVDTTDTTATELTATDTAQQPAQPARTRSVLLPLMLIIIGAGVLILLFRASS